MYEPVMSTQEAADYLHVHPETIKEKARKGELPAAGKIGNRWRFRKSSLDAYLYLCKESYS